MYTSLESQFQYMVREPRVKPVIVPHKRLNRIRHHSYLQHIRLNIMHVSKFKRGRE